MGFFPVVAEEFHSKHNSVIENNNSPRFVYRGNYLKNEKHAKWNDELVQVTIQKQLHAWQPPLVLGKCDAGMKQDSMHRCNVRL